MFRFSRYHAHLRFHFIASHFLILLVFLYSVTVLVLLFIDIFINPQRFKKSIRKKTFDSPVCNMLTLPAAFTYIIGVTI